MPVAVLSREQVGIGDMTHLRNRFALAALAACLSAPAWAGDWTNSASYNGYGAATENAPSNYSMRDANGNLTIVNGQVTSSSFSSSSGAGSASARVGTGGAGAAYAQAMAIGNSLNVVVAGSHNTTIIDAQQTNTGNQTAVTQLNTH
jgi:holdfast attachment protein HfaA